MKCFTELRKSCPAMLHQGGQSQSRLCGPARGNCKVRQSCNSFAGHTETQQIDLQAFWFAQVEATSLEHLTTINKSPMSGTFFPAMSVWSSCGPKSCSLSTFRGLVPSKPNGCPHCLLHYPTYYTIICQVCLCIVGSRIKTRRISWLVSNLVAWQEKASKHYSLTFSDFGSRLWQRFRKQCEQNRIRLHTCDRMKV